MSHPRLIGFACSPGPFTVFGPADSGLLPLGPNILDFYSNPFNAALNDIVLTVGLSVQIGLRLLYSSYIDVACRHACCFCLFLAVPRSRKCFPDFCFVQQREDRDTRPKSSDHCWDCGGAYIDQHGSDYQGQYQCV